VKRSLIALLSILAIGSMVLAACAPAGTPTAAPTGEPEEPTEAPTGAPTEEPTEPGVLKSATGAWDQEPDNIVPYYTVMSYAIWIDQLTLEGLAEWDENGALVPSLAAEIPSADNGGVSEDGLTITWKLRDGLLWSDGEPITSEDVKFTWEMITDPNSVPVNFTGYDKIASIDTPDPLTAVITFSELFPPWQTLFTQGPNNSGAIMPKHVLEGGSPYESNPFIHQPTVFSGPFMISEWIPGDHMTLVRNDNFNGSRPLLDQVQIRFVPDSDTALAALQTGDVDWYPNFSEADISTIGALEPNVNLIVVPGSDFEHYFFNLGTTEGTTMPDGSVSGVSDNEGFCPFKDVNVRKAITMGIDRQTIVDTLLEGETTVPASLWPNSEWNNDSLSPYPYDPDEAMALLDAAGYTDTDGDGIREGECNGETVPLSFTYESTDSPIRIDIGVAVQSQLAEIGVEFKPVHTPAGTFFATYPEGGVLYTGTYQLAGYTTGYYPDPYVDDFLCGNIPNAENGGVGDNAYHYCDPALDDLFAAVNATADPAQRKVALDAVQQYLYDNALFIPIYARANVYGKTPRFVPGPFGFYSNMNWNAELWDVTE
jgi:peptide/nickel transport system substrate-binding protein